MSVGLTLVKLGATGVVVGGVIFAARQYQRQATARALARSALPELPPPPASGTPSSPTPEVVPQAPVPQPPPTPSVPAEPSPSPEPEQYPPADPCLVGIYSRMPIPPEAQVYESASPQTRLVLKNMRLHLDYRVQPQIMLGLLDRIQQEPSVWSVMVRRVLEDVAPDCDWWIGYDDMLPSQKEVFDDTNWLSTAAETETGWEHPLHARKGMIPREYLGLPSTGRLNLVPGQAVELLVVEPPDQGADASPMAYGEHLIAKTLQGGPNPRVRVVDTFMGRDVAPRFADYHGFGVGTEVVLESEPPTSVYRVYPKDWA